MSDVLTSHRGHPRSLPKDYQPPADAAEARHRIAHLEYEIQLLRLRIDDPDKRHTYAVYGQYAEWRRKASTALKYRALELAILKDWLISNI